MARRLVLLQVLLFINITACDSAPPAPFSSSDDGPAPVAPIPESICALPSNQIVDGGPGKDGIPALSNPATISADRALYLSDTNRVIGLIYEGRPLAIPHNILWWHEIINYNYPTKRLAVTYCPLTGSSIVFDRANIDEAELGVSGLLYNNNLIMYDRNTEEALWSQMLSGAGCKSSKEIALTTVAHVEMTWAGWKSLYPNTEVISSNTGHSRNYSHYPYGDYEEIGSNRLLFPQPAWQTSRPPKERVLGIPSEEGGGIAFPFGELDRFGYHAALVEFYEGQEYLVLWDREKQAATAFYPQTVEGKAVQLTVEEGKFVDLATKSIWQVDGLAVSGELAGQQLEPVAEAYVAFWFAWSTFHPDIELFSR